jgi:CTP synthase
MRTKEPIVFIPPETEGMRLGSDAVVLKAGSKTARIYGAKEINERFRNMYEVNPAYIGRLEDAGWKFTGYSDGKAAVGELDGHPFFVACQFNPQFRTRPERPSPLHRGFVDAAIAFREARNNKSL